MSLQQDYSKISAELKKFSQSSKPVKKAKKDLSFIKKLSGFEESKLSPFIKAIPKKSTEKIVEKPLYFGKPGRNGKDGQNGKQGEKGDRGEQGLPGQNGKDAIISPEFEAKLNQLEKAIEGKSTVKEAVEYIRSLKGNDRIDISNIRNGEQLAAMAQKKSSGNFDMNDQRWHGGGTSTGGVQPLAYDISDQFDSLATTFTLPKYSSIILFTLTGFFPNGSLRPGVDFTTPTNTTVSLSGGLTAPDAGTTGIILYIPA